MTRLRAAGAIGSILIGFLAFFPTAGAAPDPSGSDARVVWVQGDRVYVANVVANAGSVGADTGAILRFRDRGKEIATAVVTGALDATIVSARIVSGSLARVKKLERLRVTAERPAVPRRSMLRVGYPSPKRTHPLFDCSERTPRSEGAYRADTLGERTARFLSNRSIAAEDPDTLLMRLFDDAADEEIALERGELDIAVFWPGEASPHIRDVTRWTGPPIPRSRGFLAVTTPASGPGLPSSPIEASVARLLDSMNQDLFRGDLVLLRGRAPEGLADTSSPPPQAGAPRFEVDSSCPSHETLERLLNRGRALGTVPPRRIAITCIDSLGTAGIDPSAWIFGIGCPVISRLELRPYLASIDLRPLVDLLECRPAGRKP